MAFRVCCSCKNPPGPSEGFVSRLCRVTQLLGAEIGTEDYFWSPVSGQTERWEIGFTAPATRNYLMEGFRVEWTGPTENGQKFNGLWPAANDVDVADLPPFITTHYFGQIPCFGSRLVAAGSGVQLSTQANLFNTKVPLGGHVSNDSIRGIGFASTYRAFLRINDNLDGTLPSRVRVKYWRLIENGVPVSGILNGYHPTSRTTQSMYPIGDFGTGDWSATAGTVFWSLVNEDPSAANDASYVWSGATANDTITFDLSDFEYTGGNNSVAVTLRSTLVNEFGVPSVFSGSQAALHEIELLHETEVLGRIRTNTISRNGTFTNQSFVFNGLTDARALDVESSNFIPLDADPGKFKIRIRDISAGMSPRIAISAIKVSCEPFSYFLANHGYWPIEKGQRIPWRKNKRIGFDIWLEADLPSSTAWTASLGQNGARRESPAFEMYEGLSSIVCHGALGLRTSFMPDFNREQWSYKIRFLNGTMRPSVTDLGDPDTVTIPVTNLTRTNDWPGWQIQSRFGTNGATVGLQLLINREVPEFAIQSGLTPFTVNSNSYDRLRYIPEDSGHAITNIFFNHSDVNGNVFVNTQTPGGVWKHLKPAKFILEKPVQTSTTNSFTNEPLEDIAGLPTEIEVSIAYPPQTYTYTEDDTWTCPDHVTSVTVECFGGGGGGGGTDGDTASSAGGGGGGGYSKYTNLTVTPGETYDITVGAGGTAGTLGGGNGGNGSATEFAYSGSALCKALGGTGGQGATAENASPGGSGASTGSAVGTTKFSGGNGAAGATNGTGVNGGGGGSSGASSGNGINATNSTGATKSGAGSGGSGRSVPVLTPLPGTAGSPPGGGGGGGVAWDALGSTGYAGGDGRLTLTY